MDSELLLGSQQIIGMNITHARVTQKFKEESRRVGAELPLYLDVRTHSPRNLDLVEGGLCRLGGIQIGFSIVSLFIVVFLSSIRGALS